MSVSAVAVPMIRFCRVMRVVRSMCRDRQQGYIACDRTHGAAHFVPRVLHGGFGLLGNVLEEAHGGVWNLADLLQHLGRVAQAELGGVVRLIAGDLECGAQRDGCGQVFDGVHHALDRAHDAVFDP